MLERLRLRNMLLAGDPTLMRLRLGSRVVVSVCLSLGLIYLFSSHVHALPVAAYGLGIILSVQGVLMVRETTGPAQFVTRATGVVAAGLSVTLATLLEEYRLVSDLAFLAVIFVACVGRAFGPRWNAVGMYAFMAYFMAAYFHPALADVPWATVGIAISAAVAQTVRFVVIRENPIASMRGAVRATLHRCEEILVTLEEASERGGVLARADSDALRVQAQRLKGTVLSAIGALGPDEGGQNEAVVDLRVGLIELQLAAESAIVAAQKALPPRSILRAALNRDGQGNKGGDSEASGTEADQSAATIAWLADARSNVLQQAAKITALASASPVSGSSGPVRLSFKHPAVRTAIQITLAAAIAMAAGLALSRERWFWAVLSAFLVFINTQSRGDTAMKAVQRAVGTPVGIVAGLVLAVAFGAHPLILAFLALASIFLAFYNLPVSYGRMTFFISIVIALAYALMGVLTLDLMWLRVEETLIGSVAGILVSATVFPTRTRATLNKAEADWYAALKSLLEATRSEERGAELIDLSHRLDKAYGKLVTAARPLGAPWQLVVRPGHVRQTLALHRAATYWARLFARNVSVGNAKRTEPLLALIGDLLSEIDALAERKADCFYLERLRTSARLDTANFERRKISDSLGMLEATLTRFYPDADAPSMAG
ncbi:FUSC family protein [Rhizobium sp. NRK18]|uniref:FUSC family protein n=1 Tax=Rhizobium sp. NRK18 TaxID=2964667 RepID=UPI0021C3BE90|nr:FUSC family protein [Rhizobium sp. NRK18]MCQ2003964.1 FUSC family protein [Rhizobium sp. NRK18]